MIPERFAPVLDELQPLTDRFSAAGKRLYLVGGTVRDLLINKVNADGEQDFDATTDARPAEIKACLLGWADAIWTQGERFGTIGAKKGDRIYEITTHRAEVYQDDSRKPDVTFSDEIEMDLSRRDFTVNAMALELTSDMPTLVDPFGGAADLVTHVLRTPLAPEISFSDDSRTGHSEANDGIGWQIGDQAVVLDVEMAPVRPARLQRLEDVAGMLG